MFAGMTTKEVKIEVKKESNDNDSNTHSNSHSNTLNQSTTSTSSFSFMSKPQLTNKQDVVFDPYMGVASSGVAAFIHNRKFIGIEKNKDYFDIGKSRIDDFVNNKLKYRADKPVYKKKN